MYEEVTENIRHSGTGSWGDSEFRDIRVVIYANYIY